MKKPLVSVIMITYRHEDYIQQAIEGVLMQSANFLIELIVANDCSPDKTDDIVTEILKINPKGFWINYLNNKENIGMMANFNIALKETKGKYIALCEGDDYWIDPYKLQKQVDFLENNQEYGLVCSNYITNESTQHINRDFINVFEDITQLDILYCNPIGTLTTVFRSELLKGILLDSKSMGDYPLWLRFSELGKIAKLKDYTSCYRILECSATGRNDLGRNKKFEIDVLLITKEFLSKSSFSKLDKNVVLRERYRYVFKVLINKKDMDFFKYQFRLFTDIKSINLLDLKIFIHGAFKILFR
jgi:glycosyltransferase involved in cell wall biosynthesis